MATLYYPLNACDESSCSSVSDTEMATFTFEEQRAIIRFLHLRGMKPIEIHRQLSETCSDGVMEVKNVRRVT